MLKITDTSTSPPGEWKWTEPSTGYTIRARAYSEFLRLVYNHRLGNLGLDIGEGWKERFEDDWCKQNNLDGTPFCEDGTYYAPSEDRPLHWSDVVRFLHSMLQWLSGGRKLVEQDEAERRAAICATCPMNTQLDVSCPGCVKLGQLIAETKGNRSSSIDDKLHVCRVCRCELKTKIWFPQEAIAKKGLDFPPNCWHHDQ